MGKHVGRPRKNRPRRHGATAREEILDASAELFTRQGFATTSTHEIAEAVGMRQASLYYHFPSKTEIFLTLLKSTVVPSLELTEKLADSPASAPQRLWSLVAAEAQALLVPRWNVGRLYQLPVANSEEYNAYHQAQADLARIFREIATEIVGDDPRAELPFYLAQSVVEMRANDGTAPEIDPEQPLLAQAIMVADAALDVLHAELPDDRIAHTVALLDQH